MKSRVLISVILGVVIGSIVFSLDVVQSQTSVVRMDYRGPATNNFVLYVMQEKKMLEKRGYRLELAAMDVPQAVRLFSQGHLDILSAVVALNLAKARGNTNVNFENACVLIDKDNYKILAGRHITTIQDLRGKKIGLLGLQTITHFSLRSFLKREGVAPHEVALIPEKSDKTRVELVKSGALDAAVVDASTIVLSDVADYPVFDLAGFYDLPLISMVVRAENAALIRAAREAAIETMQYMRDNPSDTLVLLQRWLKMADATKARILYQQIMPLLTLHCAPRSPDATTNLERYLQEVMKSP